DLDELVRIREPVRRRRGGQLCLNDVMPPLATLTGVSVRHAEHAVIAGGDQPAIALACRVHLLEPEAYLPAAVRVAVRGEGERLSVNADGPLKQGAIQWHGLDCPFHPR